MGLMVKAMIVLSAVADASPLAAEIVVPKVLYWLNVLVTGSGCLLFLIIKGGQNLKNLLKIY